MNKTMMVFVFAFAAILVATSVFAYQDGNRNNANPMVDRTASEAAIESGNYTAWRALHENSNGKMASLIDEGNFYLLKQMHDARESGDHAAVQEIKAKLGFVSGNGQGKGMHGGQGKQSNGGNCPYMN